MTYLSQPGVGTNGTAVSTSNATYGNQFNNVPAVTGAGTTLTYSSTHTVHGRATAVQWHYAAVSSTAVLIWTSASVPASSNGYSCTYLWLTAFPTANLRIATFATGAGAASSGLTVSTSGFLRLINSAGTAVGLTTATVPLNQWVRVEYECTGITGSTGNLAARMFSGANLETTTPDTNGTVTVAGAAVGGTITDVRFGSSAAVVLTSALDLLMADMAWSDTAQPGPLVRTRTGAVSLDLAGTGPDLKLVTKSGSTALDLAVAAADLKSVARTGSAGLGLAASAAELKLAAVTGSVGLDLALSETHAVVAPPATGLRFYAIAPGGLLSPLDLTLL